MGRRDEGRAAGEMLGGARSGGYAGSVGEGARDGLGDPSCSLVAQAVGGRVAGYKKEQLTAQDRQTADESAGIAKLRAEYRQPCRDNEFLEQRTPSS